MKPLPPEIWQLIVNQLEPEDQKTSRTLSKLHLDLATRALFAHVNVYFGLWHDYATMEWTDEMEAEVHLKNNVTWDILRHISLSPNFAQVVKKITVRAYLNHGIPGGNIFYTRALIEALRSLQNLRAFHWHGRQPRLDQDVLTALAQSSGHSLEELHIPITNATAPYLSAFPGLHELRAVDIKWHRPPSNAFLHDELPFSGPSASSSDSRLDEDSTRAFQAAMDGMAHTLTRITVAGDALWGCAIRSMLGLQELELILPETAGGLALVLRHCLLLRSLTLYPQLAQDELLPILNADPTAIPDLRAFKFIYCPTRASSRFDYQHAKALAEFIESKTQLTSLDVQIDDNIPEDPIPTLCDLPLLAVIARLPHLKVLGFSFSRPRWAPGDIQFFRDYVPRSLTALRLSVSVKQRDNDTLVQEWLDLLRNLPSLRYFHAFDTFRRFDLKQQLLEDPPASLELIGYGPLLRWLVRDHDDPDGARPEYSPSWPTSKVQFRTVDDFGCAEWEWLLRWHGAFNINDMAPGLYDRDAPFAVFHVG